MANNKYAPDRNAVIQMIKMLAQNTTGVTRQEIANATGLSMDTISAHSKQLRLLGVIEVVGHRRAMNGRKQIEILRLRPPGRLGAQTAVAILETPKSTRFCVTTLFAMLNTVDYKTAGALSLGSGLCIATVRAYLRDCLRQKVIMWRKHPGPGGYKAYRLVNRADRSAQTPQQLQPVTNLTN